MPLDTSVGAPLGALGSRTKGGRTDRWPQECCDPVAVNPPLSNVILCRIIYIITISHDLVAILLRAKAPMSVPGLGWPMPEMRSAPRAQTRPSPDWLGGRGPRSTASTWAEDRATRGRDLSAVPGAKTGRSGTTPLSGLPELAPERSIHAQFWLLPPRSKTHVLSPPIYRSHPGSWSCPRHRDDRAIVPRYSPPAIARRILTLVRRPPDVCSRLETAAVPSCRFAGGSDQTTAGRRTVRS